MKALIWRGGPEYKAGHVVRMPDDEAAQHIAAGTGVGITPVRFLVSYVGPYRQGETAGFPDVQAARLIALGLAEPVPLDDAPAGEGKGMDQPPADRMIHRAPITKGG